MYLSMEEEIYDRNKIIYQEGDDSKFIYFIVEGEVEVKNISKNPNFLSSQSKLI